MLRIRLYLGLAPLLLVVVATGAYAVIVCRELAGNFQRDLVANYEASLAADRMRGAAVRLDNALARLQTGNVLTAQRALQDSREAFTRELLPLSQKAAATARAPYVARIDSAFQEFSGRAEAGPSESGPGLLNYLDQNEAAFNRLLAAVDDLNRYDYTAAQAAGERARRLARTTVEVLTGGILLGFLLSLYLAWRLASLLLRPIRALTASAVAVGEGDLELTVPDFPTDELGSLGQAFNTMAARLREYREAMAAKVLRTQRTMEATLNSTPDALFVVAHDGRHEIRNPSAEALAANRDFERGFPEALQARVREVLTTGQHFLPSGYDHLVAIRVGREDRFFQPRILAIGDSLTGFGGAAVLLQDVTRFRLLDDAKNNLVGTVSHELKTPLTSLRMAVYLLLEKNVGTLTASQAELLETARDDADRLLRILNDLLDLSRMESGMAGLNRRDLPIGELLEAMAREFRPITDERGQKIEIRVAPGLTTVSVDPDRIRHVFINLLSNAATYGGQSGPITLYAEPADSGFVRCGVRDRGPGIPPQSVGRIFEKFYRLPGQTSRGAGLGLAICREIVLAHGGTIGCSSRPGEGSDFHFLLPGNSSGATDTKLE